MDERRFKASIVSLILNGKTEQALELLADRYRVSVPKLKIGLPKRHKTRDVGCYTLRSKTISVLDGDMLRQPFVILHEFYHHARTGVDEKHRGTEKYANDFARDFLDAYRIAATGNPSCG